jgi:hypothetical protein
MKRTTLLIAAMMLAIVPAQALAHPGHDHDHAPAKAASSEKSEKAGKKDAKAAVASGEKAADKAMKTASVTGEIVDTGCYIARGATGEKHASCAAKCIASGQPMGLLTEDGVLYLITLNHESPDAYNGLKEMAAKKVVVTGVKGERSGMKAIDAVAFKPVEAKQAAY